MKPVIEQLIERQLTPVQARLASMREEIDRMWHVIDGQAKETAALERGIAATDYLMRNPQTQAAPVPDYSSGEEPAWCALRSWMRGRPKPDAECQAFRDGFAYGFDPGFPANPTRKQPLGALKEEWGKGYDEGAAGTRAAYKETVDSLTKRAEKAEADCMAQKQLAERALEDVAELRAKLQDAKAEVERAQLALVAAGLVQSALSIKVEPVTSEERCPRTYPLDPLTAEDPCEDCGRDQRKHECDMAIEGVGPEDFGGSDYPDLPF